MSRDAGKSVIFGRIPGGGARRCGQNRALGTENGAIRGEGGVMEQGAGRAFDAGNGGRSRY